jgi:glycosyltransferase involved in cell wall biosynthesis
MIEPSGATVCLVTSGNLGSNPRAVKEADALHSAGARVHVVWLDGTDLAAVQERNEAVISSAAWTHTRVIEHGLTRRIFRKVLTRLGKAAYRLDNRSMAAVQLAYNPAIGRLSRAAAAVPADLYIAHNLAALPAAALAAQRHGAKLGFDAEDFHQGEFPHSAATGLRQNLTMALEQHYLPLCHHLTAASPGIARAYAKACKVREPEVILNVFPKRDAPPHPKDRDPATSAPSLYWFSQTIGPDRGLEIVVQAIAHSTSRPTLFLRGSLVAGYREALQAQADQLEVGDRIQFLAPALAADMVQLAAKFDIGLATEPGHTQNNQIALSNKLFTYLLAGVPVLASATTAQAEISSQMPGAVWLHAPGDALALSRQIDALCQSPNRLAQARIDAWQLGQSRFNWDVEGKRLLAVIDRCLQEPHFSLAKEGPGTC